MREIGISEKLIEERRVVVALMKECTDAVLVYGDQYTIDRLTEVIRVALQIREHFGPNGMIASRLSIELAMQDAEKALQAVESRSLSRG